MFNTIRDKEKKILSYIWPIKIRKTCGLDGRRKECINESQPCEGYKTCPLGMLYEYESFLILFALIGFCFARISTQTRRMNYVML